MNGHDSWLSLTATSQQLQPLDRIMPWVVVAVLGVVGLGLWAGLLFAARMQERAMAAFLGGLLREADAEPVAAVDPPLD